MTVSSLAIFCADGNCLVHNTSGELLHKLVSVCSWLFPHLIGLTSRGHVVVHYADQKGCIAVFSCNGRQFAQCALGDPALVYYCVCVCVCVRDGYLSTCTIAYALLYSLLTTCIMFDVIKRRRS